MSAGSDAIVYLSLGSNLGDRRQALRDALARIDALEGVRCETVSPVYETDPWGFADQNSFLNCVAAIRTERPAVELFHALKDLEIAIGRIPAERYRPRLIDIDILLYGRDALRTEELTIPHESMPLRRFVLVPLCDLAPERVHPVLGPTMRELLRACADTGRIALSDLDLAAERGLC